MFFDDVFTRKNPLVKFAFVTLCSMMACACSDSKDVAGGVTDIETGIASTKIAGIVLDMSGTSVANARVVAYYDGKSQLATTDSVVGYADSTGFFDIDVDTLQNLVLFAESGNKCGLSLASLDYKNKLVIGNPKRVVSSVSGETSGYVRVVGTDEIAEIAEDGSFTLESVPPGDITLVYVRDDKPNGHFDFRTVDNRVEISLPPLERNGEDDRFTSPNFDNEMLGVDFDNHGTEQNYSSINIVLHMDGHDPVSTTKGPAMYDIKYVEGISGAAIELKPGQYFDFGAMDPTKEDFTLSFWTKWNGSNGNRQVLLNQTEGQSDEKIVWAYDNGKFVLSQKSPKDSNSVTFGDSLTLATGEWSFLTLILKSGEAIVYVNGESVFKEKFEVNNTLKNPSFRIGGSGVDSETWNGALDDLHIESIAQTADWVKWTYQMAKQQPPKDRR